MRGWKPILLIFLATTILWFASAAAYQIPAFFSCLPKIMGKPDGNPGTIFAPIAAFFSGLSAMATAYLIYLQIKTASDERVIRHFFELLGVHRRIVESLSCRNSKETVHGQAAIHEYCEIIKYSVTYYSKNYIRYVNKECNLNYYIMICIQNEMQGGSISNAEADGDSEYFYPFEHSLKIGFNVINENVNHCLDQYFHNIYSIIKLLHDHKKSIDVNEYFRTLRSELSQEEFFLIYYYAWMHKDNHSHEKKFKELIENTCFFHTFKRELCFDKDPMTNCLKKIYEDSAF